MKNPFVYGEIAARKAGTSLPFGTRLASVGLFFGTLATTVHDGPYDLVICCDVLQYVPTPELVRGLASQFRRLPGVSGVALAEDEFEVISTLSGFVRTVTIGMSLVLLAVAVILIWNTIRTAMFARRREIEVMKLVGATDWFIRLPFMLEGLLQGIAGGVLGGLTEVASASGVGMRIDLALGTAPLVERTRCATVDRNARKGQSPSDHAPLIVDLAD